MSKKVRKKKHNWKWPQFILMYDNLEQNVIKTESKSEVKK